MMKWIVRLIVGLVVGLGGACAPYLLLQRATRQATQYRMERDTAMASVQRLQSAIQIQNHAVEALRAQGQAQAVRVQRAAREGAAVRQQAQQEAQEIEAAQVPTDDPEAASWSAQEAHHLAEGWR